jgi:hypothetical protein
MTVIENKYEIGEVVYLKTDPEQLKRIVVAIVIYKNAEIVYKLVCGITESNHYDFELQTEKDFSNAI